MKIHKIEQFNFSCREDWRDKCILVKKKIY